MESSVVARAVRGFVHRRDRAAAERGPARASAGRSRLAALCLATLAVTATTAIAACQPYPGMPLPPPTQSQPGPPGIKLFVAPTSGAAPLQVGLTAAAAGGTGTLAFRFDFGDGTVVGPQSGAKAAHLYTKVGTFQLTATVTDSIGRSASATQAVTVSAPTPHISASATTAPIGQGVTLTATGAVPPAGDYTWNATNPNGLSFRLDDTTTPTYFINPDLAGTWTFSVDISDAAGAYRPSNKIQVTFTAPAS
ncbi:PKD domain-containing protein [Pseudofrankia inefficax]|uniref:PKD domain containing protein n=1 Tax=Pseudofrankia inefficax (strain DSM 45817 / CECT 9037 / DDB 130130 / EuI1c) TaxID=298654 RepID=E3J717_PSEI1|nr:PKD domain-containing protein [Pseudofrankia inefficax]ADP84381.1 PKD domain containing protein [Pseudofrankia inefficax]